VETTIYLDENGEPQVTVKGVEAPENVAKGYKKAVEELKKKED